MTTYSLVQWLPLSWWWAQHKSKKNKKVQWTWRGSVRLTAVLVARLWMSFFLLNLSVFLSSFCFFFLFWSLSDIVFWHLPSFTLERSHGLELELVCGALVVEHRKQFGILYMVDHTGRGSGQLGFARFWLSFFILFATRSVVTFLVFVGVLVLVWFVTQQHVESCRTDFEFWRIVVYDGLPNHCCM